MVVLNNNSHTHASAHAYIGVKTFQYFAEKRLSPSLTYEVMLLTNNEELSSPPRVLVRQGSSIISSTQGEN